tara:strand:+ start:236 stop:385 length:150 start_codon:yes stop_codon:yes gene_type:complete
MKVFKKLDTGIWVYTDKQGHIFTFTEDEFLELNKVRSWWSNVKNKYFKL